MSNCWVIGDVHGCAKTLQALVYRIRAIAPDEPIVIAGDLVDRGPDSAGVIQFCIDNAIECVLGNHEQMMLDYCNGNEYYSGQWLQNGGAATRASYLDSIVPEAHLKFLQELPKFLFYPEYKKGDRMLFISHAGLYEPIHEGYSWIQQAQKLIDNKDLWWHRDAIWDHPALYQVIGHTPQQNGPSIHEHFACIDTGACYFSRSKYNRLTALQFPAMQVISQTNIDNYEGKL